MLHPYFKLDCINQEWDGEGELEADLAAGRVNPTNWKAHARERVEEAVRTHRRPRTATELTCAHPDEALLANPVGSAKRSACARARTDPYSAANNAGKSACSVTCYPDKHWHYLDVQRCDW